MSSVANDPHDCRYLGRYWGDAFASIYTVLLLVIIEETAKRDGEIPWVGSVMFGEGRRKIRGGVKGVVALDPHAPALCDNTIAGTSLFAVLE